jgi:hypothetical protein
MTALVNIQLHISDLQTVKQHQSQWLPLSGLQDFPIWSARPKKLTKMRKKIKKFSILWLKVNYTLKNFYFMVRRVVS